jgi:hypothetical protein
VATLQKIGQDWGKRLEKGLAKDSQFAPHDAEDKEEALSKDLGMHGDVS